MSEQDWRKPLRELLRALFTREMAAVKSEDVSVRKRVALAKVKAITEHLPQTVRAIMPSADMSLVNEATSILREVAAEVFEVDFEPKDFPN